MADDKTATPAPPLPDSIPIDTDPTASQTIPIDLNPEYDPAKDKRPAFQKVDLNPKGPTVEAAPEPSLLERAKKVVTEGIPQFSTRTVENPKYGQQQFLAPEEALTPKEQREHPVATGALEAAGGLTSPATVSTVAATAGLGEAGIIPKVLSGLFAGQIAVGVYDQYPALKAAVDKAQHAKSQQEHDDAFSDAQRILTHMGADTVMGLLAAKHGAEGAKEILDATTGSGVPDQASTFKAPGAAPAAPEPEETHPEMNRETVKKLQDLGYSNQHITNFNISEIRDILKNQTPAAEHPVSKAAAPAAGPDPDAMADVGGKLVGSAPKAGFGQEKVSSVPGDPNPPYDYYQDNWKGQARSAYDDLIADPTQAAITKFKEVVGKAKDFGIERTSSIEGNENPPYAYYRDSLSGQARSAFDDLIADPTLAAAQKIKSLIGSKTPESAPTAPTDPGEDIMMSDKIGAKKVRGATPKVEPTELARRAPEAAPRGLVERTTGDEQADAHIKAAGAIPAGQMAGLVMFHDPKTGSTLALKASDVTPEAVQQHMAASRKAFGLAPDPDALAEHGGKFVGEHPTVADKATTAIANLYMDRDENAHPFTYSYSAPFTNKTAPSLILPDGRITNARLSHSELARAAGFEPKAGALSTTHIDDMLDNTGVARVIYPDGGRGNIGIQIHQPPTPDQLQIVAHNLKKAKDAGIGDGSLVWDLKNSSGELISGHGSVGDFRRAVAEAYPDQQDILSPELQTPHKETYGMEVTDRDGNTQTVQIDAHSPKTALAQTVKKFPDASEWRLSTMPEEKAPSSEYSVPTGKLQKMKESAGRSEIDTIRHEYGHFLIGRKNGMKQNGVLSSSHPDAPSTARAVMSWSGEGLQVHGTRKIRPERLGDVVGSFLGGIAADEVFNDTPRAANHNFFINKGGDGQAAYDALRDAGYDHKDAMARMHELIEENVAYLSTPEAKAMMAENAPFRETGLSRQYHASAERLENMHTELQRRLTNAQEQRNNTGTDEGRNQNNPADVAGGKSEISRATGSEAGAVPKGEVANAKTKETRANLRDRDALEQNVSSANTGGNSEGTPAEPAETEEGIVSEDKVTEPPTTTSWEHPSRQPDMTDYIARHADLGQVARIRFDPNPRLALLAQVLPNTGEISIGDFRSDFPNAIRNTLDEAIADAKQQGFRNIISSPMMSSKTEKIWKSLKDKYTVQKVKTKLPLFGESDTQYVISLHADPKVGRQLIDDAVKASKNYKPVSLEQMKEQVRKAPTKTDSEDKDILSEDKVKKTTPKITSELAQQIADAHTANGGSTFNLTHGDLAGTDNYAVSAHPERGELLNQPPTAKDIKNFADKNKDLLKDPEKSIGTWHDTSNDTHALDVVATLPDREKAVALGKANDQKAIYHLKSGETIDTGGTGAVPSNDHTVSTRVPTGTVKGKVVEDHTDQSRMSDMDAAKAAPGYVQKMVNRTNETPGFLAPDAPAQEQADAYIRHAADNIKFVHGKIAPEEFKRDEQWYPVGAHERGQVVAKQHDVAPHQVYAVTAVESPMTDWDQNTSLAERTINIWKNQQNTKFTPEMQKAADKITSLPANKAFKPFYKKLQGKTLAELPDTAMQAHWLRLYDEAHNPREYETWGPDGTSHGLAKNQDGSNKQVGWSFQRHIEKAIDILKDGSDANISKQLGYGHKVRNFYNNQLAPDDPRFLTMDTHAINIAQLRPMSGKTKAVRENFGAIKNGAHGLKGTYPMHDAAYRLAAKELDIPIPGRLQSPTWVKIRDVFTDDFKTKENQDAVDAIWKEHEDGKITADEARNRVWDYATRWNRENTSRSGTASEQGKLFETGVRGEPAAGATGRGDRGGTAGEVSAPGIDDDVSFVFGANAPKARSRTIKSSVAQQAKNAANVAGLIEALRGLDKPGKK